MQYALLDIIDSAVSRSLEQKDVQILMQINELEQCTKNGKARVLNNVRDINSSDEQKMFR